MHIDTAIDLLAATSGFASSAVLLVTAIRATPLQALLDKVEEAAPGDPGYDLTIAVRDYAKENLAKVKLWDPRLLYTGIALLGLSYGLSILKDICFSGR